MLTVHLITKNNQKTIESTLKSISILNPKILVGDCGSKDNTIDICKKYNAKIINLYEAPRNELRKMLSKHSETECNLWIEPWEVIIQNDPEIKKLNNKFGYARILQGNLINWDIRFWKGECNFVNPIFERIETEKASNTKIILSSKFNLNFPETWDKIQKWKNDNPLSFQPFYYQSCLLLANGKYDDFLKTAEHYLFLEKEPTMSAIMTRYYYAMIQVIEKKSVRPALQNLNICLCVKPLMAEFWCLTGDVYYHLLQNFSLAKEFYENAIILGSKRLEVGDYWPMDLPKYKKYPNMMIESCNKILNNQSDYIVTKFGPQDGLSQQ